MSSRMLHTVVILALAVGVVGGQGVQRGQTPSAAAMFEAARKLETIDGDLKGAIKHYEAIVKTHGGDRATVARALLQMGECYQKLGDQQAARLFGRIVREFPEQRPAADAARARLANLVPDSVQPARMINRQLWTGADVDPMGTISGDGRYLSFVDWSTGNLAIRDLSRGTWRPLTPKTGWESRDYAEESAIARDGTSVAYSWFNGKSNRYELRLLRADASPGSTPRILFDNPDVGWIGAYDWSPDGLWIAVQLQRVDRTAQIGLIAVKDGSFKPLISTDWLGSSRLFFSPDGTRLAYDLPQGDGSNRDVFILGVDGAQQTAVAAHRALDLVAGWSPDGASVFFASDRAGSLGLWSVPLKDGRAAGAPQMLKPDLGAFANSVGVTRSGVIAYAVQTAAVKVVMASIDLKSRKRIGAPVELFENSPASMRVPDWSPDGSRIVALLDHRRTRLLAIRSIDSSEGRDIRTSMSYLQRAHWRWPDTIVVEGVDLKGRPGIFRVDVASGETTPVVLADPGEECNNPWPLPDGRTVVYRCGTPGGSRVIARDVVTGDQRALLQSADNIQFSVSPDGRLLGYALIERLPAAASTLNVMSLNGGTSRELHRLSGTARFGIPQLWTPDSGSFMFTVVDGEKRERWVVPANGGSLSPVDPSFPPFNGRLHPDGRTMIYQSGLSSLEIWTLENVLPSAPATSTRR